MSYTIEKVAALIGAHRYGSAETHIEWLLTDSRSLAYPETTLFFALRTRTGDGHKYIDDLYRRGVRNFVVSAVPWKDHDSAVADYGFEASNRPSPDVRLYPDANFLEVISPLKALQRLAERHREEYDVPVVGVTGSNGKTCVKEWIYQLLCPSLHVTRSPRSYNSQIGVPMSVWLLTERTQVGVFEAGISQRGEMPGLRAIIQPTIGVMTNVGAAHQENFATIEEKCMEKLSLFDDAEVLIYDADDTIVSRCLTQSRFSGRHFGWSMTDSAAPLYIERVEKHESTTTIAFSACTGLEGDDAVRQSVETTIPFTSDASVQNAINTIATGLVLGLTPDVIAERLTSLTPVAMRLEVKQGVRGLTLINDAYNSDLTSLDIALDFLHRRAEQRRSVLILSDLEQTGLPEGTLYRRVAEMIRTRSVDVLIGIGPNISAAHAAFDTEKHFFYTTDELLDSGLLNTLHSDIVLLKGARSFGFDLIAEQLELKVHETVLEVNLGALADNVRHFRSFMRPETKLVCMVKAGAYGSGSIEVARTLQDLGVDYLAVAVADEGVELRKAGITMGIIIMNPEMSSFTTLFKYRLEPEIYSFRILDALVAAARKEGITDFPVHVKLDTGMCRLGFNPDSEIPALVDRLRRQQALRVRSVFSHFVGSDSDDFNEFSDWQFERFDRASRQLQEAMPYHVLRHICNSAGIERFPERHLDMCRLGIGLYGVDPVTNSRINNVTTLRTTILQIRDVATGTSVGYSRRTIVDRPSRIAAIPIGYADGLDRHLGNRNGYALVNGQKAPYVGNICMDVCMLDVTGIDCREGDCVEIFGDNLPVTVLSDILGTIPYEFLTSVSERVKRVYYQ